LKEAIAIDENMPVALVALGRVYEKKNEIELAIECYEKVTKQPMTNFNAHFYLGVIYEKKKEYKKSITLFKQCLNNDKQHFGACIHLATLLANAGEA
jgi:tetratricopeptide (TPR) repeat protein